jgi:hypothetical protein
MKTAALLLLLVTGTLTPAAAMYGVICPRPDGTLVVMSRPFPNATGCRAGHALLIGAVDNGMLKELLRACWCGPLEYSHPAAAPRRKTQ